MVGSLSGIRTKSGIVAVASARHCAGTLVRSPCLLGYAGRAPSLHHSLYPGIRLTTEEKSRKTLSEGSRKCLNDTLGAHSHSS